MYMKGADKATPSVLASEPRPGSAMSSASSISADTGRLKSAVVASHPQAN